MADDTDTPKTEQGVTPRRRAPRKSSTARNTPTTATAGETKPRRRTTAKPAATSANATTTKADQAPATAATVPRRARAPQAKVQAEQEPTAKAVKARTAKPRAAKRPTPPAARKSVATPASSGIADKVRSKLGVSAIGAGLAAAAGAVAATALLTLRGSTPKPAAPDRKGAPDKTHAHAPDGRDASKSFEAGIADENTIPE